MKKIILLFVAVLSFTVTNAQEKNKSQKADATTRATEMTEKMAKALALTADQKAKVQVVNLENIKLMDLNKEKTGDKPNEFEAEKQRIKQKWDNEMTPILTAEGLQKWKKHVADEKAKK